MQKEIVWESHGYLFGIPFKHLHYVLYKDSITVQSGLSLQKIQSTKLHNIITKEMTASPIARLFHCGKIRLMTWGASTPDLEMYVKHPKEVFQLIEDTKQEDHRRFVESRKQNRYKNERKQTGGKRNAPNDGN